MRKIIADITKANFGTEADLLQTLGAAYPNDLERVWILCKENQKASIAGASFQQVRSLPATAHYTQIARFVQQEFLDDFLSKPIPDLSLVVVSFHPAVLGLREFVPTHARGQIEFIYWVELFKKRPLDKSERVSSERASADHALTALMPEEEVLACVRRVLSRLKATDQGSAARMATMRLRLEDEDPRFKKSNPGADVKGIIGAVIRLAESRGLVATDRSVDMANYLVWLKAAAETGTNAGRPISALPTEAGLPLPSKAPGGIGAAARLRSRSDEFVDCLRAQGLGPFSRIRPVLYKCLQEVMGETVTGGRSILQVLGETVGRTQALVPQGADNKPIPWRKVREFLRTLLARRPVLLRKGKTGDESVTFSLTNLSVEVSALSPDWRHELDGELVVALISAGMKIHDGDLSYLAGALYNDRSDQAEAKAGQVLDFLLQKTKRIKEGSGHFLELA